MGTGHSADTPIRVGHLGISSVISLVDDLLLERLREYYSARYGLPFFLISKDAEDGRARRTTAYLDMVREIVDIRLDAVRKLPFFKINEKSRYFELLPESSGLRRDYNRLLQMKPCPERESLEKELTARMSPGSVDVNLMVKLDRVNYDANGNPLGEEYCDSRASLRGFALSRVSSRLVFSAGLNQPLFSEMTKYRGFYRDQEGRIAKKIVLKVSDFRSAMIQGKVLAKKGLEVSEFRVESGLNCGGHCFPSNGNLLPCLLQEFKDKRDRLSEEFRPVVKEYYGRNGWEYPRSAEGERAMITVQGGIGTHGEMMRLFGDFGLDMAGWATPFLLVPEATAVDDTTREQLRQAGKEDVYPSKVSPMNMPFSNLRNSGSERWTRRRAQAGRPGSSCPKGFLVGNTEFTERPICTASRQYQELKLESIAKMDLPEEKKEALRQGVMEKTCICDHLGNGALIALGLAREENSPQAICPGPNIAWFNSLYTLEEMVDHIYGRGVSLVSPERPHMFATEIGLYVDYFEEMTQSSTCCQKDAKAVQEFRNNLEYGMDFCLGVAAKKPYRDENLASIAAEVKLQRARLQEISSAYESRAQAELCGRKDP